MDVRPAEKLILLMLCDLYRAPHDRQMDAERIRNLVENNDEWVIPLEYPGLGGDGPTPPEVAEAYDFLDLWRAIEGAQDRLSAADRAEFEKTWGLVADNRFPGFDGNNEGRLLHVANVLVEDLGRYPEFKGRVVNSHSRTREVNQRRSAVFQRMLRDGSYRRGLTLELLLEVMRG